MQIAIDSSALAALLLASLALMGSPGPSTISCAAMGAAFGFRGALAHLAGIIFGTWSVLALVATGVTVMILSVPGVRPVLIGASSIYILYLAWKIATAPPMAALNRSDTVGRFAGALAIAFFNPKAWFAIGAVFSGNTIVAGEPFADAVAKLVVLGAMVVVINLSWTLLGSTLAGLLRDPRRARIANVTFAILLVAATAAAVLG